MKRLTTEVSKIGKKVAGGGLFSEEPTFWL